MTVRRDGGTLFLEGRCAAADAETLLVALQEDHDLVIDASGLTRLHLAVAQVLLACRPFVVAGPPNGPLAAAVFAPLSEVMTSALPSAPDSA